MSYILDALRKADAQRERDPARGIHAQPASPADAASAPPMRRWGWGVAAVCGAALAAYLAWPQQQAVPVAGVAAPAEAVAPVPVAPAVTVATIVSPPPPAPLPTPVVARTAGEASPAWKKASPPPGEKAPSASGSTAAATPAAPSAAVGAAAAAPDRIFAMTDLPADVQRELPKLAISGGVHSENAAQRLLIVGGDVVKEGAELAPGVVLEQIRSRNAVLRYRGYRYSVAF